MSQQAKFAAPDGVRNDDVDNSASGARPSGRMAVRSGERGRRDRGGRLGLLANRAEPTAAMALGFRRRDCHRGGRLGHPSAGWTLGHRGPNWVALNNADTSAQTADHGQARRRHRRRRAPACRHRPVHRRRLGHPGRCEPPDPARRQAAARPQLPAGSLLNYTATVVNPQGAYSGDRHVHRAAEHLERPIGVHRLPAGQQCDHPSRRRRWNDDRLHGVRR